MVGAVVRFSRFSFPSDHVHRGDDSTPPIYLISAAVLPHLLVFGFAARPTHRFVGLGCSASFLPGDLCLFIEQNKPTQTSFLRYFFFVGGVVSCRFF